MYVLIFLILSASPLTEFSIEFSSEVRCEFAREKIAQMSPDPKGVHDFYTVCVPK